MRLARGEFFGQRELACRTPSLDLVLTSDARGQSLPSHEHERAYLVIVLAGSFREGLGRREHRMRQGMLLLNTCGARHHDIFEAARTEVLNVEPSPRWLEALGLERSTDPRVTDGQRFPGRMRTLAAAPLAPGAAVRVRRRGPVRRAHRPRHASSRTAGERGTRTRRRRAAARRTVSMSPGCARPGGRLGSAS